jgi:hypothetical protein
MKLELVGLRSNGRGPVPLMQDREVDDHLMLYWRGAHYVYGLRLVGVRPGDFPVKIGCEGARGFYEKVENPVKDIKGIDIMYIAEDSVIYLPKIPSYPLTGTRELHRINLSDQSQEIYTVSFTRKDSVIDDVTETYEEFGKYKDYTFMGIYLEETRELDECTLTDDEKAILKHFEGSDGNRYL